uniref:Enhancer of yellow 2 transcription factor n=1 Tax=Clastoptera arizonana TaxID=38151 RepID=A0A1B6E6R7_9HEMI
MDSSSSVVTDINSANENGIQATTIQALTMEGDYDRFKVLLKRRLHECGWTDQIRVIAREIIKEKNGIITAEKLFEELAPKGRALVPSTIKKELLQNVKEDLLKISGYYNKECVQDAKVLPIC